MTVPPNPGAIPKHLPADDQPASQSGAGAEDRAAGHGGGNGYRVHGAYIVVVSIAALVMMVVAIAVTSAMM